MPFTLKYIMSAEILQIFCERPGCLFLLNPSHDTKEYPTLLTERTISMMDLVIVNCNAQDAGKHATIDPDIAHENCEKGTEN